MADPKIDLSAGLVPAQSDNIDLSSGMVPAQSTGAGGSYAPEAPEQPGMLSRAWDWLNKGIISKETFTRAMSGMTPEQLKGALAEPEGGKESPAHAAVREFLRGAIPDTAETASSFTSPLAVGTMAAGPISKLPKAAGRAGMAIRALKTAARVGSTAASVGFGAEGAKDAVENAGGALEGDPEAIRKTLTGGAMVAGGAAGVGENVVKPAVKGVYPGVEEMTGTTPERLAELKTFPDKMKAVQATVKGAEQSAHAAAKAAFPDFPEPIEIKPEVPPRDTGAIDAAGKPIIEPGEPAVTTTFKDLQEKRSGLLKDIANEKRAVAKGAAPRFDLADKYEKLSDVDHFMEKAAVDQGGPEGLAQLQAARQQYRQYMDDFHNPGSPLKPMLDMKPDETSKIVNHLTNPDKGARSLEALRRHGVDTTGIEQQLSQGNRPLKVTAAESGKMRAAGDEHNYKVQRMNESVSQLKTNELPGSAQARVPAAALRSKWPSVLGEIPGANLVNPRRVNRWRVERALDKLKTGKK